MAVTSSRNSIAKRWLYLPDGWDTGWKAARGASATSPALVTVIGDSNAQGFQSTDHMTKSFAYLLRNRLIAKYGRYGDFWSVAHSAAYSSPGTAPGTMPWTFDSTFGGSGDWGLGPQEMQTGGTFPQAWVNAGNAVFTTPYACTDLDIISFDWNQASSTWKYNVDNAAGGGLVTVTNDGRNSIRRIPITGLANTTHTVRIGGSTVSFAAGLNGMVTYDPAGTKSKGIGFANIAGLFMQAANWAGSAAGMPDDRIRQLQGRYKTAPGTTLNTGFGFPTQPHLAIIELGINDCQSNIGLTQFRAALRRFCDALRLGQNDCSILFVVCPHPTAATTDMTTPNFTRGESWELYVDQIYGIAQQYQCAVANFHADWMSTPVAQGFITATDAHPTDLGHQAIADVLSSVIV